MIRVVLADDHTILRDKIRELLTQEADLEIVGQASNGLLLLEVLAETATDVVVLDMHMPAMDGLAAIRIIRQRFPEVKVLVLSLLDHERYAAQALEAGALGYVLKNSALSEIIHAIRTVSCNVPFLCTEIGLKLVNTFAYRISSTAVPALPANELETKQVNAEGTKHFLACRKLEKHCTLSWHTW